MELRRLEGSVCGKLSQPTIFDEHIHFLPTSESCRNPVSWITMVRDPVEMYISRYLYARRPVVIQVDKVLRQNKFERK